MQRHALTPFTNGLVNLETGQISREIFVNEAIYQQEQEQVFMGSGSAWDKTT
jgi:hypothetical protein